MTMKSWSCAIGTTLIGLSSGAICQAAELIVLTNQGAVPGSTNSPPRSRARAGTR